MKEMAEINRLIKKAVKNMYRKLTYVQNQHAKKTPTNAKPIEKTEKQ